MTIKPGVHGQGTITHCVRCGKKIPPRNTLRRTCSYRCMKILHHQQAKEMKKTDDRLAQWEQVLNGDDHA